MPIRRDTEIPPPSGSLGTLRLPHRLADFRCVPLGVFLFALPFAHTVALRLIALVAATMVVVLDRDYLRILARVPLKVPIALWMAMAIGSLAWAIDPAYSRREILNEIGYPLLAFLVCYAMATDERSWLALVGVLVAGFLAISCVGLYWFGRGFDQITDAPHGGVGYYSTYLITVLPLMIVVALRAAPRGFPANGLVFLIPLLLLDGYGTGNRTFWPASLLAILTFALLYALQTRSTRAKGKVLVLTAAFAVLTAAAFVATVHQRALPPSNESMIELIFDDPRIALWAHVTNMIERLPLTGGGFGRGVYGKELTEQFASHVIWHGHNLLLNYALQMGIGGVLVLLVLLFAIGLAFWRLYRAEDPIACLLGAAGLALISGFLTKNMTDDFFVRQNALLFWSMVGLMLGYGSTRAGESMDRVAPVGSKNAGAAI